MLPDLVSQSVISRSRPRSPLLCKLSSSKGWGGKCTRSHVCCLGPVCGLRSAKDERLGTRWCTERAAESCMHSQIISTLLRTFLFLSVTDAASNLRTIQFSAQDAQWSPSMSHRPSPEASAMAAPRSPSRSPEAARRHLPSTPICVTDTAKVVMFHGPAPRSPLHKLAVRLRHSRSKVVMFHGPAPRSPLHQLAVRLRHSRSNTSTNTATLLRQ